MTFLKRSVSKYNTTVLNIAPWTPVTTVANRTAVSRAERLDIYTAAAYMVIL